MKALIFFCWCVIFSFAVGIARTQADELSDLEEKVNSLEEEIVLLQEGQESVLSQLGQRVKFNLYATLEYENFNNTNSSFDARNVELLADARLTGRLRAFAEIEFERTAKTSGGSRAGEVEVEQGWLEYAINNYFNPRFGVILIPFGRFNLEHFDPSRDLTDRPITMRLVVPTTWAEAGAGFTGQAFLGDKIKGLKDLSLNYEFYVVNGLTNDSKDTSVRDARGAFGNDNNNNKAVVGRLGISPFSEQEIGFSFYLGTYDKAGHDIHGFDIDWKFTRGPFEFIGEYALFDLEKGGFESDSITTVPEDMQGFYVQANYHFWFEALNNSFLGRNFENPTFTAVVQYDQASIADDGDPGIGDNDEDRFTIGLNYRPVETWVFKLEYQFNNKNNESLERGNNDGFIASVSGAF